MKKIPILLLISITSVFYGKNTKPLNMTGYVYSSNYVNLRKPSSLSGEIITSVPAVIYTDFWEACEKVIPAERHQAVGKQTGKTNYIERFNFTLRQKVSRLVRKSLSFSKKVENHIGAIWYFFHHYNSSLDLD